MSVDHCILYGQSNYKLGGGGGCLLVTFKTTYDVLTKEEESPPGSGWLIGVGVVGFVGVICIAVGWAGWETGWGQLSCFLGSFLLGPVFPFLILRGACIARAGQQKRSRAWIASGDVETIEGEVHSCKTRELGHKASTRVLKIISVAPGSPGQIVQIRCEVQAEFAAQLSLARWWKRPIVRHRMHREIKRRVVKLGSREFSEPDYFSYPLSGINIGAYVRITHHEGEILKVEIAAEP